MSWQEEYVARYEARLREKWGADGHILGSNERFDLRSLPFRIVALEQGISFGKMHNGMQSAEVNKQQDFKDQQG